MKKLLTLALFTTYNKQAFKQVQLETLNGKQDDYHCFHVDQKGLEKYLDQENKFSEHLIETVKDCKNKNMKAIWVQLGVSQLQLATTLIEQGFEMHHCTPSYLLFSQWIVENEKNRLPNYTTHAVGAGGLIIHNDKVLLVQEKNGPRKGLWGIPGGLSSTGELIIEAATREVKEETGLDAEPYDCFFVRDQPIANQYNGDIYFVIMMKLKNQEQQIKLQNDEISAYQWVHLKDLEQVIFFVTQFAATNQFRQTQQKVMQSLIQFYKSDRFGKQLCSIDPTPRLMYGKLRKYCFFKANL